MKCHYLDHNAPVREGAQTETMCEGAQTEAVCEGAQTETGRPSAFCYLDAGETIK